MTTRQPEALRLADELCEAIAEYPEPTALEAQAATELRRQHARITEIESQLAQRFDAADMATAAAQGFRDGAAKEQQAGCVVIGEKFQRAWLRLDELPGTMMIGPEGRFGPVPASTSAWVTTSASERARHLAEGKPMLEVWLTPPSSAQREVSQ